jgi:hypothetical protein
MTDAVIVGGGIAGLSVPTSCRAAISFVVSARAAGRRRRLRDRSTATPSTAAPLAAREKPQAIALARLVSAIASCDKLRSSVISAQSRLSRSHGIGSRHRRGLHRFRDASFSWPANCAGRRARAACGARPTVDRRYDAPFSAGDDFSPTAALKHPAGDVDRLSIRSLFPRFVKRRRSRQPATCTTPRLRQRTRRDTRAEPREIRYRRVQILPAG